MSAGELLAELKRLGVKIEADGDRLRYAGPQEAISPELIGRLKVHKAELMAVCAKTKIGVKEDRNLSETVRMRPASDLEVRELHTAGWEPKERCGKLIWKHPDNGFYYSQEMAAHFLGREISDARCKSGANGKG